MDYSKIVLGLSAIGLDMNPSKSEIVNIGLDDDSFIEVFNGFESVLSGV